MPKGVAAYKSPIVLQQVDAHCPEPYRTALLLHAHTTAKREEFLLVTLEDVDPQGADGKTRINGVILNPPGVPILQAYLQGHLATIESAYLFPLPSDPAKPASEGVAKRYLAQIVAGKIPGKGLPA